MRTEIPAGAKSSRYSNASRELVELWIVPGRRGSDLTVAALSDRWHGGQGHEAEAKFQKKTQKHQISPTFARPGTLQSCRVASARTSNPANLAKESAKNIGLAKLAAHDLRRPCARLCHAAGAELEQIQLLLGHVSVQTTERVPRLQTADSISS
jgi:integrase